MSNPWESISLSDYEAHMSLEAVMQFQTLNNMMDVQLNAYPAGSVMILGVAGGNGLEHIDVEKYSAVYGVDVNPEYLQEVRKRYSHLDGLLKCICIDLINESDRLPQADMIIANLLIEYIGYECFRNVIKQVRPKYVSCGIQINTGEGFVSNSPYLHSFDGLESIHHKVEAAGLTKNMNIIGYNKISENEYSLPNGKKLVMIDFVC